MDISILDIVKAVLKKYGEPIWRWITNDTKNPYEKFVYKILEETVDKYRVEYGPAKQGKVAFFDGGVFSDYYEKNFKPDAPFDLAELLKQHHKRLKRQAASDPLYKVEAFHQMFCELINSEKNKKTLLELHLACNMPSTMADMAKTIQKTSQDLESVVEEMKANNNKDAPTAPSVILDNLVDVKKPGLWLFTADGVNKLQSELGLARPSLEVIEELLRVGGPYGITRRNYHLKLNEVITDPYRYRKLLDSSEILTGFVEMVRGNAANDEKLKDKQAFDDFCEFVRGGVVNGIPNFFLLPDFKQPQIKRWRTLVQAFPKSKTYFEMGIRNHQLVPPGKQLSVLLIATAAARASDEGHGSLVDSMKNLLKQHSGSRKFSGNNIYSRVKLQTYFALQELTGENQYGDSYMSFASKAGPKGLILHNGDYYDAEDVIFRALKFKLSRPTLLDKYTEDLTTKTIDFLSGEEIRRQIIATRN